MERLFEYNFFFTKQTTLAHFKVFPSANKELRALGGSGRGSRGSRAKGRSPHHNQFDLQWRTPPDFGEWKQGLTEEDGPRVFVPQQVFEPENLREQKTDRDGQLIHSPQTASEIERRDLADVHRNQRCVQTFKKKKRKLFVREKNS